MSKQFRGSKVLQRLEQWERDTRPRCYQCGKSGYQQEAPTGGNSINLTLDKISGNSIANRFSEHKLTKFISFIPNLKVEIYNEV